MELILLPNIGDNSPSFQNNCPNSYGFWRIPTAVKKLAQERLREMWPDLLKRLWKIEEQIESDPKNLELRKEKRC
jgi:hypothetical protein